MFDLTVPEVVSRMKELPRYGYLFKSTANAGLGANNQGGGRGGNDVDPSAMTPENYRKWRKTEGLNKV